MVRLLLPFCVAVLCTFTLASLAHTQFVLFELGRLGVPIDFLTRLYASWQDWLGLLPLYGAVVVVALLVGFSLSRLIVRQQFYWRYPLAGGLAMAFALLAMQPVLEITLIAGARSWAGFVCQCLAGIFGGWVFNYAQPKAHSA